MSRADAPGPKALRKAAGALTQTELRALIGYVRTRTMDKLLAQAAPSPKAPKAKPKPPRDTLLAELTALLKPILGPASEKAELLMEHMGLADARARGLSDGLKQLRTQFSDAEILAAAKAMMAGLAKRRSMRETVT